MTIIAEPTPVHTVGAYYHAGRGGAGNYYRLQSAPTALSQPPTVIPVSQPQRFYGGRGGAGNVRSGTERAIFSFDEELERDRIFQEHQAPVYSVGRGGAGNIVPSATGSASWHRSSGSPRPSTSSSGSERSAILAGSIRSSADRVLNRLSKIRSH